MTRRWSYLYHLSIILSVANLCWFLRDNPLQVNGIELFLKIFLILSIYYYLYRGVIHLLSLVSPGLPVALLLLFGYLWGSGGPVPIGEIINPSNLLDYLWIMGALLLLVVAVTSFGHFKGEQEIVPIPSQHLSNILLCIWITLIYHLLEMKSLILLSVPGLGIPLFLILMGPRINTRSSSKRITTVSTVILLLAGLWLNTPHWPPRLKTNNRSVLLITVEGVSGDTFSQTEAISSNTHYFPSAFSTAPERELSLANIFTLTGGGTIPEQVSEKYDRQAVLPRFYLGNGSAFLNGFTDIHHPGFSSDALLALVNFVPLSLVGEQFTEEPWKKTMLRQTAEATTSKAVRLLQSVKEPFFIWIAFPAPSRRGIPCELDFVDTSEKEAMMEEYHSFSKNTATAVDELLAFLRDNDFFPQTRVLIVGLNGVERFEHGRFGTFPSLYPEMLRVPLLLIDLKSVSLPREERDITPDRVHATLLNWLKIHSSDNRSISASLLSQETPVQNGWAAETLRTTSQLKAFYTPEYILIINEGSGEVELFDRNSDPGCKSSIHLLKPEKVGELMALMETNL